MRTTVLIAIFGAISLANTGPASAADLRTSLTSPAAHNSWVTTRLRVHRVSRGRAGFWKTVGMPCLLTPDRIVRLNWNGPQCRWVDNVITPWDIRLYRAVR